VAELEALGLAPPQTVALLHELQQRGLDVPLEALTVEACAEAIAGSLGK